MSWAKLDDQFFAHPKVIDLSKDAKLLFLAGLTYCAGQLTDGLISPGSLRMIAAQVDVSRETVDELVMVGLWEVVESGYHVHDYLDYNPPAEKVKEEKAKTAARVANFRERHPGYNDRYKDHRNSESNAGSNSVTTGGSNAVSTASPSPSPSPSSIPQVVDSGGGGGEPPREMASAADAASTLPSAEATMLAEEIARRTGLPHTDGVLAHLAAIVETQRKRGLPLDMIRQEVMSLMDETRKGYTGRPSATQISNWLAKASPPTPAAIGSNGAGSSGLNGHQRASPSNGYRPFEPPQHYKTPDQAMPRAGSGRSRSAAATATGPPPQQNGDTQPR